MKKTVLLVVLLSLFSFTFATNVVSVDDAKTVSKNFISAACSSQDLQFDLSDFTLQHTEYDENGEAVYYRFAIGDAGFIIVSATDLVSPVLAYSVTSKFESNPAVDSYVNGYKEQIIYVKQQGEANVAAAKEWNYFLNLSTRRDVRAGNYVAKEVEPLVTTRWNQTKYYNMYCPFQSGASSSQQTQFEFDNRVPVGCVAVNMGVILYYYRYPEIGRGGVSYIPVNNEYDSEGNITETYTYPRQTASFEQNYNYSAMSDEIDQHTGEIAKLLWHNGISAFMGYGPTGSGTQSALALEAMKLNWKFNQAATMESRSSHSVAEWENLLINELDSMRPIYYSASRADGGHAFILDGYQTINETHTYYVYTDSVINTIIDTTFTDILDTTGYDVTADTTETAEITDLFLHWDYTYEGDVVVDSVAVYGIVSLDSTAIIEVIGVNTTFDTNYVTIYTDSVVDHIDSTFLNNMFHVNWGWGGYSNGYFRVSGAGYLDGYAENEAAFINLYPAEDITKPTEGTIRITSSTGSISDGAGNQKYQPSTDRTWIIATPDASRYTFNFAKLKTEQGADEIIVSNAGNNNELARFSGNTLPSDRSFNADSLIVRFVSNANDVVDYGFVINFTAEIAAQYCTENAGNSTGQISDQMGVISDKGDNYQEYDYNTPYRAQTRCNWRFFQSEQYRVYFAMTKFELGYGDFIDILDVTTTSNPILIKRYDVYNFPEPVLTCDARRVRVIFNTDNWDEGNGFEMTYQTCTGINENGGFHDVSVYPNPASNYLYVDLTNEVQGNLTFKVVDMTGKVIAVENVDYLGDNLHHKIDLNNLAKGLYMLNIESAQGKVIRKFIVE